MNDLPFVLLDNLELAAIDHSFWAKQPGYRGVDWAIQDAFCMDGYSIYGVPWVRFR